ncbi:hypothetical protein Taro_014579 [Colocasia esculenta]|uniref:FANCL C-terminal domain-containing protein n=1 Tax=Colocasia esculenta TaxID=4460 RepID=A0A843UF53_COLES|nr:hypothetical protein [Colocasia esculenta]
MDSTWRNYKNFGPSWMKLTRVSGLWRQENNHLLAHFDRYTLVSFWLCPLVNSKPFPENLETLLGVALPSPPCVTLKDNELAECGICYVHCLPVDQELGAKNGITVDYTCDNPNCRKAFHTVCLRDWLRCITTTRQSFDVLFGKCPYCSEAVAVKSE